MKKRALTILALFLALLMLAGCGADAVATSFVIEQESEAPAELCSFDEIEYVRPDMDSMYVTVAELEAALKGWFNYEQIYSLIDSFTRQCTNFNTMYDLSTIRACLDVTDEYYDAEYTWCMETDAEVQMLVDAAYSACANSVHAWWLERYVFWEGFREEYRIAEDRETNAVYEDYFRLVQRETELLAQYRDIVNELTIEIDGQLWDYDEYLLIDYDRACAAYYEKYNPILAELYIDLMETRREIAGLMGYDSYADYIYAYGFGRDYSPEQAGEFMAHVKTYIASLGRDASESGLAELLMYDPVDERELELYLETLVEGLGGSIEQAYDFMKEYRMYDFGMRPEKAEGSFQIYLSDYEAPYLFLSPYGYTDDVLTLCHEFGHYADSYIRKNAYESIDLAEVYSQAMQLIGAEQLRCLMTEEEYYNFRTMNLLDMLSSIQEQTAFAEFELRAFEMEEPTAEKLNELCDRLLEEYGVELDYAQYGVWVDIPHLFENPFYVVSYSVSVPLALQIYELELEEPGRGARCFVELSESLIPGLMEAAQLAGMEDPLSESSVRCTADFIRSQLMP